MLEFYYDFLDFNVDRSDYKRIQMDTDSMYLALSTDTIEEVIKPELKKRVWEGEGLAWLAWDKWSKRTPDIFKKESEAIKGIALCSKCYFMIDKDGKIKLSSKGMSKK